MAGIIPFLLSCVPSISWMKSKASALEHERAAAKWRTLQRDERVEPRSLIKSNWETSIRSRVYSPEKINGEPRRGWTGGLWEKGWEVHEVRGRPGLEDTDPYYFFTQSQRKVSQSLSQVCTGTLRQLPRRREEVFVPHDKDAIYPSSKDLPSIIYGKAYS